MKTTYAPIFPKLISYESMWSLKGPIADYYRLIAMRNAKVSIGAKLNYGK